MKYLLALHANWLFRLWLAAIFIVSIILCMLPMTHILGFEFSFITGVILPLATGHIAAAMPAEYRAAPSEKSSTAALRTEHPTAKIVSVSLGRAGVLLLVPLIIIFINQIFVSPCNNRQGLLFYLMMPVLSSAFATFTGLFLGTLFQRRRQSVLTWYLLWAGTVAISLMEAYNTPAVFSFGPYFGYWPGVWYDRQISITSAFLTYRLYNAFIVAFLLLCIRYFVTDEQIRFRFRRLGITQYIWLTACGIAIAVLFANGPALGHRTSTASLKNALPHHIAKDGIHLYFDAHISARTRLDITRDAQFSLNRLRHFFKLKTSPPITVFVFKDADQKQSYMGARHTSVAKPWLGQTYIVAEEIPHWTLRHELAHLVAAQFGTGPFRVAAGKSGMLPVPALIEGTAVAATPTHTPLSLHQTAKAMKDLHLLPPIRQLMGVEFLSLYSHSAYTASGSFCLFVHHTFGADALKQLYSGKSAIEATGFEMNVLEQKWHRFLDNITVPKSEMAEIQYRFDRPSIIDSRCDREVSRLRKEAAFYKETDQWQKALEKMSAAYALSGNATDSELTLFFTQTHCSRQVALSHGARLLRQNIGRSRHAQIAEALIDVQIGKLSMDQLADKYHQLIGETTSEDDARRVYAKYHFAQHYPRTGRRLLMYLSTTAGAARPTNTEAIYILQQMQTITPTDPLLSYLKARILFLDGAWYGAATEMNAALQLQLKVLAPRFLTQARFTLGRARLRHHQYANAIEQFEMIKAEMSERAGYVELAEDWIQRAHWQRSTI